MRAHVAGHDPQAPTSRSRSPPPSWETCLHGQTCPQGKAWLVGPLDVLGSLQTEAEQASKVGDLNSWHCTNSLDLGHVAVPPWTSRCPAFHQMGTRTVLGFLLSVVVVEGTARRP